jgi:hypothetical protein
MTGNLATEEKKLEDHSKEASGQNLGSSFPRSARAVPPASKTIATGREALARAQASIDKLKALETRQPE